MKSPALSRAFMFTRIICYICVTLIFPLTMEDFHGTQADISICDNLRNLRISNILLPLEQLLGLFRRLLLQLLRLFLGRFCGLLLGFVDLLLGLAL